MSKAQPEYPIRLRHYFKVELPENLRAKEKNDLQNGWMDVVVISEDLRKVEDWGCLFEGNNISRPEWMREQCEDLIYKICVK